MDDEPKTLKRTFAKALWRSHTSRPMSFYLLLAIIVVMILGTQLVYFRNDPTQFALYLTLMFVFYFVVAFRATLDFFDITRSHLKEQQALYRNTLGENEFVCELGRRVTEVSEDLLAPQTEVCPRLDE